MNIVVPKAFTRQESEFNSQDHSLSLAVLREKQFNAISKMSLRLKGTDTQEISNSATFLQKDENGDFKKSSQLRSPEIEKSHILLNSIS